jgi:hypothetical protein
MVISEVFRDPAPDVPLAGPVMLLERLQVGIAGQLAVLDDAELTGTGQSSADVLGVPGAVLADRLTATWYGRSLSADLAAGRWRCSGRSRTVARLARSSSRPVIAAILVQDRAPCSPRRISTAATSTPADRRPAGMAGVCDFAGQQAGHIAAGLVPEVIDVDLRLAHLTTSAAPWPAVAGWGRRLGSTTGSASGAS